MTNHGYADSATIVSISSALLSIANFQPLVTLMEGLRLGIITGRLKT